MQRKAAASQNAFVFKYLITFSFWLNQHLTASDDQVFRFAYDSVSDKYGYITESGGADTFNPFSSKLSSVTQIIEVVGQTSGNAFAYPHFLHSSFPYNRLEVSTSRSDVRCNLFGKTSPSDAWTGLSPISGSLPSGAIFDISSYYEVYATIWSEGTNANNVTFHFYD